MPLEDIDVISPCEDTPALRGAFADLLSTTFLARTDVIWFNPVNFGAVWNASSPVDNTGPSRPPSPQREAELWRARQAYTFRRARPGRSHANVRGVYLKACSHFHMSRFAFSGFNGVGAGHALTLDESYDCTFSRGLFAYCGRNAAAPALETALEAVQIMASTIDNCNRVTFELITGVHP